MTNDVYAVEALLIKISRQTGAIADWGGHASRACAQDFIRAFPSRDPFTLTVGELVRFIETQRNVPQNTTRREAKDLATFLRSEARELKG